MTALLENPPIPVSLHGEAPEETDSGFQIDDDRKAAWAASKLLAAKRRIANRTQLADAYQTRILDWLARANEPDQSSIVYLEVSLRPWVERVLAGQSKARSVLLPGARIGLRKKPDRVDIVDLESAVAFCMEHLEEVVVVKRDLSKTELKRHLNEGARIPGVTLTPGVDELTVAPDGKGEES